MDAKTLFTLVLFCFGISATFGQQCQDKLTYCSQWPLSYCTTYKDYMKQNCPKRCGYCTTGPTPSPDCADKRSQSDCRSWKSSGYCAEGHRYQPYMKINCKKACGFCGGSTKPTAGTTKPTNPGGGSMKPTAGTTNPGGSCSTSTKLNGCSFDSNSCDFVDVPFDDNHDFVLRTRGGEDGKGFLSSSGRGNADLIYPLELLVSHNGNYGNMCMEFSYRIRSGSLTVYQVTNWKNYPKETKLSLSDTRGSWKKVRMSFKATQGYHILFRSTPSSGSVDIDNIRFCDRC